MDGVREDEDEDELYVSAGEGMRNGESAAELWGCVSLVSVGSASI